MFCVPIIARDTKEAVEKMSRAESLADMVEIRLDVMDSFDLRVMIHASRKPVLVTYRSIAQGGRGTAGPDVHVRHLLTAIEEGADFVDVESTLPDELSTQVFEAEARAEARIVVSTHINDHTPSRQELNRLFSASLAARSHIIKIVTMAETWEDNLRVLELIPLAQSHGVKMIAFCMGPLGRISRVFSHLMGGYLTFASLETGQESADGQIPLIEMKKLLESLSL